MNESKKKENEKEKVENIRSHPSRPSNGDITDSSTMESSMVSKHHSNSTVSIPNGDTKSSHPEDIKLDEREEEGVEERERGINGYTNATYDKSHDGHYENSDVIMDDKPPPYESVTNHENTKM